MCQQINSATSLCTHWAPPPSPPRCWSLYKHISSKFTIWEYYIVVYIKSKQILLFEWVLSFIMNILLAVSKVSVFLYIFNDYKCSSSLLFSNALIYGLVVVKGSGAEGRSICRISDQSIHKLHWIHWKLTYLSRFYVKTSVKCVAGWPSGKLPFDSQKIAKNLTYFPKKLPKIFILIFLKKKENFWQFFFF